MKKLLLLSLLLSAFVLTTNAQITGGSNSGQNSKPNQGTKDYLFKNGLFMDGVLSTGNFSGIAGRIGNRWNFGSESSYRIGFQVIWGRLGIYGSNGYTFLTIAPLNVGVVGTMKFTEKMGLEAAFNLGYNTAIDFDSESSFSGILINPEVKFRYKIFAVGLDLAIMTGGGGSSATVGISGGFRF